MNKIVTMEPSDAFPAWLRMVATTAVVVGPYRPS